MFENSIAGMNTAQQVAIVLGDTESLASAFGPEGILRQEAEGQAALVNSTHLPRRIQDLTRPQMESIGFKFGENVDDLFVHCELPTGWQVQATSHSMWSDLLDAHGFRRGGVFYKAAFYDRSAHMNFSSRFRIASYEGSSEPGMKQCEVHDARGGVAVVLGKYKEKDWAALEELETAAKAWLESQYPDWQNPLAYWD